MGNHAKRRAAAAALRTSGLGKLYGGRTKMAAWRMLSARHLDEIGWKARFAVRGMVVDDCYGTNFTVVGVRGATQHFVRDLNVTGRHGALWYRWIDQLEYEEGVWSCGCWRSPQLARTRDEIEGEWLAMSDAEIEERDGSSWKRPGRPGTREIVDHLRAGGHVLDERGRLLPEWAWYPSRR